MARSNLFTTTLAALVMSGVFLAAHGLTLPSAHAAAPVKAWEYLYLQEHTTWTRDPFGNWSDRTNYTLGGSAISAWPSFDKLGADGWELVTSHSESNGVGEARAGTTSDAIYVFKRPKN